MGPGIPGIHPVVVPRSGLGGGVQDASHPRAERWGLQLITIQPHFLGPSCKPSGSLLCRAARGPLCGAGVGWGQEASGGSSGMSTAAGGRAGCSQQREPEGCCLVTLGEGLGDVCGASGRGGGSRRGSAATGGVNLGSG